MPHDEHDKDDHGEVHDHTHDHGSSLTLRRRTALVVLSGVILAGGLALQWLQTGSLGLRNLLFLAATFTSGALVVPDGLKTLRSLRLDMNVLMMVAVVGAWLIGEHAEAASVVFLFALSELLESFSVGRARTAIQSLLKLTPEVAVVKNADGSHSEVPVDSVTKGAVVLLRSGERVPLDGEVLRGNSSINQAPITGEAMPVEKKPGDIVYAGTINGDGSLEINVTQPASGSMLSRIIKLVEEAGEQKAPTQRFVDRFARYYTPGIFILAVVVALIPPLFGADWGASFYRSLVLLVIACPCALVIATPVSIVSGLTAMARRGVLIKGGAILEAVGGLRALAVDKTGTITEGRPKVQSVQSLSSYSEDQILQRAASIDVHSQHPIALAVVEAARARNITFSPADDYHMLAGRGATGTLDGHPHFVGNHRHAHETGVCTPEVEARLTKIEGSAQSVVVVGHAPHGSCKGEVLGIIAVGDSIRPEANEALRLLHASGIEKVVMLSGDNQRAAGAIAQQVGIDEAYGDLLPEDKVDRVKSLVSSYHRVGMVGDGVNDAPALAAATVGIAMGAIGSDTAIETADLALMKDDLRKLAEAIHLGRRTLRIIQFNIGFALAIKAVFLILAFLGHTSLWLAIAADTGATLLVIANALRLLRPGFVS